MHVIISNYTTADLDTYTLDKYESAQSRLIYHRKRPCNNSLSEMPNGDPTTGCSMPEVATQEMGKLHKEPQPNKPKKSPQALSIIGKSTL